MQVAIIKKELDNFPSLREAFMVNQEGIQEMQTRIKELKEEQDEVNEKLRIAVDLGIPKVAFKRRKVWIQKAIERAETIIKAYSSGYLEVPDLGPGMDLEWEENEYYGFRLPGKVPLRVLQALKEVKDKGLFEKVVVFTRESRPDPIIAGQIENRFFYITSYR